MKNHWISRSKIDLFLECSRCFWLDVKKNIRRPEGIKGTFIGAKYDPLLKKQFDYYRQMKTVPEFLEKNNLRLYEDKSEISRWRHKLFFFHKDHQVYYYGKIDDLLVDSQGRAVPFDFKTTLSKERPVYNSEKRQLEIYGYLLKKNGLVVASFGYIYIVKIHIDDDFQKKEERELVKVDNLEFEKYDEILKKLKEVLDSDVSPNPSLTCQFCQYQNSVKEISE